ncbi:hypothetical protein [Roseivivax sediminis]|uniref:Uncharacterized protein n=1 Tax=Roseivivax sediminis TaxID=936889 RepID=A0A1I1W9C6_9RHOB|nr:hypothetical protein [Roseivivax sediminis]SFD91712.1 hypothetical protein SAMN04515678_104196 [Roseivivax sediminis]
MERKRGTPTSRDNDREDRLRAALKANLARRKAQAKAREAKSDGDEQDKEDS